MTDDLPEPLATVLKALEACRPGYAGVHLRTVCAHCSSGLSHATVDAALADLRRLRLVARMPGGRYRLIS